MTAAFWLKASDEGVRYLYVVPSGLTDDNFDVAYGEVLRIAGAMSGRYLDPFRVRLIGLHDPLARAALDIYRQYPGRIPTRFNGPVFGGIPVDEVYLYPPPKP